MTGAMGLPFAPGDPVPLFRAHVGDVKEFNFFAAAGRYVVVLFVGTAGHPQTRAALDRVAAHADLFDDIRHTLFVVTSDPADRETLAFSAPGMRVVWDFDCAVSRAFGVIGEDGRCAPLGLLLDPTLRVIGASGLAGFEGLVTTARGLPPIDAHAGTDLFAPVLVVPRVLERALCARLIDHYRASRSMDSGFMREIAGETVGIIDHGFKRRRDCAIEDRDLADLCRDRIQRRLLPEIKRCFQFVATRIERYIVACYSAEERGFFRAHRDDTTPGTAHRKFAVTINLNAEDFTGGDLRFPEFGNRLYRCPTGGAIVFSCSVMHEAMPVRSGERFVFLPFLYDEEGAAIRERNLSTVRLGT